MRAAFFIYCCENDGGELDEKELPRAP